MNGNIPTSRVSSERRNIPVSQCEQCVEDINKILAKTTCKLYILPLPLNYLTKICCLLSTLLIVDRYSYILLCIIRNLLRLPIVEYRSSSFYIVLRYRIIQPKPRYIISITKISIGTILCAVYIFYVPFFVLYQQIFVAVRSTQEWVIVYTRGCMSSGKVCLRVYYRVCVCIRELVSICICKERKRCNIDIFQ